MRHVHALLSLVLLPLFAACAAPDSGSNRSALVAGETKPDGCGGTPSDPGEPAACFADAIGDGTTCLDPGDVKTEAFLACQDVGLELIDLYVDSGACGGQIAMAKYTCCPLPLPSDPPPDTNACFDGEVGDGVACQSAADLKAQAIDACDAKGGALTDLWFADGCPDGESSKAGFSCCLPQPSLDPQSEPDPKK